MSVSLVTAFMYVRGGWLVHLASLRGKEGKEGKEGKDTKCNCDVVIRMTAAETWFCAYYNLTLTEAKSFVIVAHPSPR